MKSFLQNLMQTYNRNPSQEIDPYYLIRPEKLIALFKKYHIVSIFDSGCKDLHWMRYLDFEGNGISYLGGDISKFMVDISKNLFPDKIIINHDCTVDPFPEVDLLLSNDVMIHLSNKDRIKFLKNFCSSNIKYLLMSDSGNKDPNLDIEYGEEFPMAHVNWYNYPWNFPEAMDYINDKPNDQRLKMWSRNQLTSVVEKL